MRETERIKYLLVNNNCYRLTVDFKLMRFTLEKLSPYSEINKPESEDLILTSTFTASSFVSFEDLYEYDKNLFVGISINLSKQVLYAKHKGNDTYLPAIAILDSYLKVLERWERTPKENGKIKECKLENVVLEDETKEDILRTINFIKNMDKYKEMGCTLPSGILLEGEPGTGKTLIAKTIASESNMNFEHVVASDFAQKYVGESAKHVEKIFKSVKDKGGGVIFIDELDAIGGNRDSGDDNKEYRSCLNKLLACMSEASENNIIVIGATNVVDQLDPALIREGRIDQVINIPLPNFESRVKLFKLYVGKLKHEDDVDYELLAEKSDGKSGAFISSVCNHAGMYAVDKGFTKVKEEHLEYMMNKMVRDNKDEGNVIGFINN